MPTLPGVLGGISLAQWKRIREINGQRTAPASNRDPICKTLTKWGWVKLDSNKIRTNGGILDLARDGVAAVKQVCIRAWKDDMWKDEARAESETLNDP